MSTTAPLTRIAGRIYVTTPAGAVEIVASHGDRTRARWWRGELDGRAVTPWVGSVTIAAAFALSAVAK